VKRILLRLGDYLFVMRPLILIPAWSFYLIGAETGRRQAAVADTTGFFGAPPVFYYGLCCLTAVLIAGYLINQVFDRESDRRNQKGFYLTQGIFSVRTVLMMAFFGFLVASWAYRFVDSGQRLPLVLALVLSMFYSMPPLRLVARPFVDLLANAAGYGGLAFVAGYAAYHDSQTTAMLLATPYVCLVGATFLFTTILDVDGDKDSGKITTSVVIGVKPSALVACILTAIGWFPALLVSWRLYSDRLAVIILSACLVVFVVAAIRTIKSGGTRASSNAVQVATVLITVPALIVRPEYALLLVPILLAARLYYRARFGIRYPGPAPGGKET
jgi:4-hydroxybenzoate polyprenyltransferase